MCLVGMGKHNTRIQCYTNKHFKRIMNMTSVEAERRALLVPYSLRYMFITNMIKSGGTYAMIGTHCGTSIEQIEKTYAHISEAQKKTFATMRYVEKDGNVVTMSDIYSD